MRRPVKIDLPQPCTESWEGMTPVAGGRHCSACSKAVIDFTSYTDAELLSFFSRQKETVCGRLLKSQVGLELYPPAPTLYSRFGGWRAAAILLCTQLFSAPLLAQKKGAVRTETAPRKSAQKQVLVHGRLSAYSSDLPGVPCTFSVRAGNGPQQEVTTDSAGNFVLKLPPQKGYYRLRWEEQQIGGGTLLEGFREGFAADLDHKLLLFWQGEKILPPVVITAKRTFYSSGLIEMGGVSAGTPVRRKESFFRRITRFLHKTDRR
jgi:hypothetical protein